MLIMGADWKKIGTGIGLCMIGIVLLEKNHWLLGLASFIVGFLVLMKPRKRG